MEMIQKFVAILIAFFSIVIVVSPVRAIIVLGPQGRNVVDSNNPVPYSIDGYSLDQYVGTFGSSLGTPISSKYFVTAYHVNTNSTNDYSFVYNNGSNIPIVYDVHMAGHSNDLAIWEIVDPNQAFDLFAPVYTCQDEVGSALVTLGRGVARGTSVEMNGLRGWTWSAGRDGVLSWGTNTVSVAFDNGTEFPAGSVFAFDFNNNGDPNEGTFSSFDSGGATFVFDPVDQKFKLAGVNSGVTSQFSESPSSGYFDASLFDARGYYVGSPLNHELIPTDAPNAVPSTSFATRMSTRLDFINQVTGLNLQPCPVPEPSGLMMFVGGGLGILGFVRSRGRKRSHPTRPLRIP